MDIVIAGLVVAAIAAFATWRGYRKLARGDLEKWGVSLNPVQCPSCGTALPMFRQPTSWRQRMWGGWTCPGCGAEIDRKGRLIAATGEDQRSNSP